MNHENCIHYEICDRFLNWRFHEIKECERFMEKPKHGEWIRKTDGLPHLVTLAWFICSECGVQKSEATPFCPNCGASMRKEGETE